MGTPIRDEKRLLAAKRAIEVQASREADTAGMSGGRRRKAAPAAESEAEIEGYGKLLGQHLSQLHGGAFHKAFARGLAAYGNPDVTGEKVEFSSVASKKLKGGNRLVGAGPLKVDLTHEPCPASDSESDGEEEKSGGALTGRYEGEGLAHLTADQKRRLAHARSLPPPMAPKREEGPAHKADQRKVRGALIKAVKAKHGLASVIEANKYVSAHGLWPMTPEVAKEYGL